MAPGGYGAADLPGGLLEPKANGALVDPYAAIGDVARIDAAAAILDRTPPMPPPALEAALKALEAIGRRDPNNPSVPFWRGRLLRALRRPEDSLEAFERCLKLGRQDPEVYLLGLRSARAAKGEDGAFAWAEARDLSGRPDARILLELAEIEAARGHGPQAEAYRQKAARRALAPERRVPGCR